MIEKSAMRTLGGQAITQSLFLELGYSDHAVYTLKGEDYTYRGKVYPSLKRLYMEAMDPHEYDFASEHLLGWDHWQRIVNNKQLTPYVNAWRRELEIKIRSVGFQGMLKKAEKGDRVAQRWLAEKGYDKRPAGRPSSAETERQREFDAQLANDWAEDLERLRH
jgi:hypothetical protein